MKIRIAIIAACLGTFGLGVTSFADTYYQCTQFGGVYGVCKCNAGDYISSLSGQCTHPAALNAGGKLPGAGAGQGKQPISDQAAGGVLSKKKN